MKQTDQQLVIKKIDEINERIQLLINGKKMSSIDRTITKVRELIERCKSMEAETDTENDRLLIAQVFLERALGELVMIHTIVRG